MRRFGDLLALTVGTSKDRGRLEEVDASVEDISLTTLAVFENFRFEAGSSTFSSFSVRLDLCTKDLRFCLSLLPGGRPRPGVLVGGLSSGIDSACLLVEDVPSFLSAEFVKSVPALDVLLLLTFSFSSGAV